MTREQQIEQEKTFAIAHQKALEINELIAGMSNIAVLHALCMTAANFVVVMEREGNQPEAMLQNMGGIIQAYMVQVRHNLDNPAPKAS